jgi:YYY domain-containing protein
MAHLGDAGSTLGSAQKYNGGHMSVSRIKRSAVRPDPTTLGLVAILIAAFALRIYRLNWDDGQLLHPDELHIVDVAATRISFDWPPDLANLLDPSVSHLNPRSDDPLTGLPRQYAYGALPVLVTDLVASIMTWLTGTDWTVYFDHLHKIGRVLSAVLDSGTVLLIYLLGRRLFDRQVGLLAATLYGLAPMTIQLAHFFTTDSWLTFFVALTLLFAVHAAEGGRIATFAAAGFATGLALATKGSVVALAAVVVFSAMLVGWQRWQMGDPSNDVISTVASRVAISGVMGLLGFGLFEPYALARPAVYLHQLRVQSGVVRGTVDAPYTRQYVGTTPLVYQAEQLVGWGLGPVTGLLCLVGVVVLLRRLTGRYGPTRFVVVVWLALQGLVVVLPQTKFLRYAEPLLPALTIAGGVALIALKRLTARRVGRRGAGAVVGAALAGVLLWTGSFESVYAAPHTRLEASRWIYENVPNGSVLGVETWDDALPVPFGTGLTPWDFQYQTVGIDLYGDRPPAQVADELYRDLQTVDYVVMASNRIERGVGQLPWRYPVQVEYYKLLTTGELGFRLAAQFERSPGIGPLRVEDQWADESFLNYDHPEVLVYKKDSLVPRATYDELMAHAVSQPFQPTRHKRDSLMLDQPVGDLPVVADARWSAGLTDNSLEALVVWIALLAVFQFVGLPLARIAFGRFADAGWSFARSIAFVVPAYLVWIGASVQAISFRAIWAGIAVGLLALTWLLARNRSLISRPSASQRRTAWVGEAVFWAVFAVFLSFRWINPDSWHPFWGGEKPMEFAHINAILRSAHFPPYDPWFADGYINYYYYGLYLVAFSIKLTGIPTEIAFNFAQPTMMALLASAGYGVAATLARGVARRRSTGIVGGLAGAVLLVGIGNLEAISQVIRTFPERYVPTFVGLTWQASRVIPFAIDEFPYFTGLYADLHAHVVALPLTVLVIGLCLAIAREPRVLTVVVSDSPSRGLARTQLGVRLALVIVSLGALFPTNAWDVPVYAALAVVSIFMATAGLRGLAVRLSLTAAIGATTGILAYVMYLPFHTHYVALFGSVERVRSTTGLWEFLDHLGGLLAIVGFGLVVALIEVRRDGRLFPDLPVGPLIVLVTLLLAAGLAADKESTGSAAIRIAIVLATAALFAAAGLPGSLRARAEAQLAGAVTGVGLAATLIAVAIDRLTLGMALAFATAGVVLWLRGDGSDQRFIGALIAAAGLVAGGVEVVFLADDLVTIDWYRMNTVFKFYNQVWVLLALAGAGSIALLLDRLGPGLRSLTAPTMLGIVPEPLSAESTDESDGEAAIPTPPPAPARSVPRWAAAGLVVSGVAILASLAYPLLATKPRLEERFVGHPGPGTLNAIDWMKYGTVPTVDGGSIGFADDLAAIDWLNAHVHGSPVIAEASIGPYRCNGSRISINTGLPTIIGWERHETQQRYLDGLAERVDDVHALYASPDAATKLAILRKYGVQYVVVGQLERLYPEIAGNDCVPTNPADGIAAFDGMVGTSLEVAFQSGTTTVYRVLPPGT